MQKERPVRPAFLFPQTQMTDDHRKERSGGTVLCLHHNAPDDTQGNPFEKGKQRVRKLKSSLHISRGPASQSS